MKWKFFARWIPLLAIALVGTLLYQQWQQIQAQRPDYDNPNAPSQPSSPNPSVPLSEHWQVVDVHDGDTITVRDGTREEKIRFCGIDAPELQQPGGEASREHLRSLIASAGNQVIVIPIERDRYGRQVAEVLVSAPTRAQPEMEKFLNYEQVVSGNAYLYARYVDHCPNGTAFAQGEVEARRQQRGVWANPAAIKPWDYRKAKR